MGDIKNLVNRYVRKYGTRDPFRLAEHLNICVQIGSLGCAGCYMFLKNHRYIFLDQDLEEWEQRQVMAHELGHAIMHRKLNCYFIRNKTFFSQSKIEKEANLFAAELLIPEEIIVEHQEYTSEQLARVAGYSEKLMELKLSSLHR